MDEIVNISIGLDFTRFPLGRHRAHGEGSGEAFREEFLVPALRKKPTKIVIRFDDALGYGSSFLDESFGGLVREGYKKEELLRLFEFVSEDVSLIDEVKSYIIEAKSR